MPVSNSKEAPWADLTDVIEMPRGMTEEEVYRLLTTGEVPADPRGPTEPEDESPELADAEVVLGEGDALALLAGIPVGGFVAAASDDDGWRKQLRAPRGTPIGGQWVESLGGVIRWITAPGEKKTRGATIYKKHEPGEVVAARGDGGAIMRVTPDGARYEVQARSDGDWKREATLTKKQAYDRVRGDEDWREPNTRPFSEDDDENEGLVESRQVEEAPEISETTSKDVTGKNQVDVMDSVDRNSVLAEIEGDGDRQSYMRSAVSEDVGDSGANYVARDAMGRLTGALAVRDYSRDEPAQMLQGERTNHQQGGATWVTAC